MQTIITEIGSHFPAILYTDSLVSSWIVPGEEMGIQHKSKSVRNANKKRVRHRKYKLRSTKKGNR